MGTWSTKPFGNDTARDLLQVLERAADESALLRPLNVVLDCDRPPDAHACEEAVAAAALISAACRQPIGRLPEEAKAWVLRHGYAPSPQARAKAALGLARVVKDSELRDLWDESGSLKQWQNEVESLAAMLRAAASGPGPARKPKPARVPRSLAKLMRAAALEGSEAVRAQLRKKLATLTDVNAPLPGTAQMPPLCLAAAEGLVPEAALLLDKGANPDLESGCGDSPLVHAAKHGQADMVDLLLRRGGRLHKRWLLDPHSGTVLGAGDENGVIFECAPGLFAAAAAGSVAVIEILVRNGADLKQVDLNGETLLHKAAEQGHTDVLQYLVRGGLDVNKTKDGNESPLHYAVRRGRVDAVRCLLALGADPNIQVQHEGAALDVAGPDSGIAALLRAHGARCAPVGGSTGPEEP